MNLQNLNKEVNNRADELNDQVFSLCIDKLLNSLEEVPAELLQLIREYKYTLKEYVRAKLTLRRIRKKVDGDNNYDYYPTWRDWENCDLKPFYTQVARKQSIKNQVKNELLSIFSLSNFDIKQINRNKIHQHI